MAERADELAPDPAAIARAAAILDAARRGLALTGAGISTESGIPDFRSPGGIWSRYDPEEFSYQNFIARAEARRKYWQWGLELYPALVAARPNPAHFALADLERRGRIQAVVTQNIDDLHRRAGSRDVIELHGTALRVGCLRCRAEWPREDIHARLLAGDLDPRCDRCGGILKPRTISFGEPMPAAETRRAFALAESCDVFLVVGSSLVVHPAASLVPAAAASGAHVIIVNRDPTPYDDLADEVLRGSAGAILPRIAEPPRAG